MQKLKLKKIKGDASFRIFFRKNFNDKKSILVYSKKNKKKNLLIYDAINKILIRNKILAPKLYNENYNKDHIEIEDFGDETLFKILRTKKNNQDLLKRVILLLKKIQEIRQKKVKNFKNINYKIPIYSKKLLFDETKLFCEWYVPNTIKKKNIFSFNKKIKKEIKFLISNIKQKNNVFVHRDFHVSNLMKYKKKIAVIDNQDAVIGNRSYDLASLIDDVRIKTSNEFKKSVYDYYLKINKTEINKIFFKNDFEILSILRNLKIIGIFSRLALRDKKKRYLKLIPYAWQLIDLRLKDNLLFKDIEKLLNDNFSKKIRIRK
jgi:N-acetylmuramate 1-kinase